MKALLPWALAVPLLACSAEDVAEPCLEADGMVETEAGCLPWKYRHEPAERLDFDNVINPSGAILTELTDLPDPPKSGFRLVLTPQEMAPFEEYEFCHSWALPPLVREFVYTAEVHSTIGLHHANLMGIQYDERGPQPYPDCFPGAASFIGGGLSKALNGVPLAEVPIPEVLFANSTQIEGGEHMSFPEGRAYPVHAVEVVADAHVFNPTPDPLRVEVVYDFYTMPSEEVIEELRAFMYMWTDFKIPAQSQKQLTAECDWYGGNVSAIMPHMHSWGTSYDVKFLDDAGNVVANPYTRAGFNLPESDIEVYGEPVNTDAATRVQFTCGYDNTTDHPMCHGIGENEMCFFFGYVGPAEHQGFGMIPTEGAPCAGSNRFSTEPLDLADYISQLTPEVRARIETLFFSDELDGALSTCPDESPGYYPDE